MLLQTAPIPAPEDPEVVVQLPRSWARAACTSAAVSVAERLEAEAALVTEHGSYAWTLQTGGCGQRGARLQLPRSWLLFNASSEAELEARTRRLGAEVTKLTRGVFEEAGFSGDPVYPATYSTGSATLATAGCHADDEAVFCPASLPYNPAAPSKQNLLCGGRGVASLPAPAPANTSLAPSLRYVTAPLSRWVLVLDLAQPRATWTRVKRGLARLLSFLPEAASLAIVTQEPAGRVEVVLAPTLVTETQRAGLHGLIPRRAHGGPGRGCGDCGLAAAVELLGAAPGNIVIVSAGDTETTEDTEESVSVDSRVVRVFRVITGAGHTPHPATPGTAVYTVADPRPAALAQVFLSILNTAEEEAGLQKIFHADHDLDTEGEFSGHFYVEEGSSGDLAVTLSIDDEQKVESFEVRDSAGRRNIFSKFEDGLVIIKMLGAANSGLWSYHGRLYEAASLSVDAVCRGEAGPSLQPLASIERTDTGHTVLLASLTARGGRPVTGARVTARVGGAEVQLRDAGTGYPDITRGDGVYSAYLPAPATPGWAELSITAHGGDQTEASSLDTGAAERCCGSQLPTSRGASLGQFTRHVTAASLYLPAEAARPAGEDSTPPARVSDLRLVSTNTTSLELQLQWSAPGGDLDTGAVSSYEIRCSTEAGLLAGDQFLAAGVPAPALAPLTPAPYLAPQLARVAVPAPNTLFYYALVSRDAAGNVSPVSNLVAVLVPQEVTSPAPATPAPSQLRLGGRSWLLNTDYIIAIAGGCGGVLLLIILAVVAMILKARRRGKEPGRGRKESVLDTYEAGFYPDIKLSKPELEAAATTGPGDSGVYTWLDGLQQKQQQQEAECYDEGSSCSRPTTSTDDSLSHEEGECRDARHSNNNNSGEQNNNTSSQELVTQMQRARLYGHSFRQQHRYHHPAYHNPHRYGPAPGPQYLPHTPAVAPHPPAVAPHPPAIHQPHPQLRKQRHESVV